MVRPQTQPPISSFSPSFVLLHLRVGGDRQRFEADLHRLAEGDDAAQHRQPPEPVALAQGTSGSDSISICALGAAHRDRPDRDASHHHALQHRLAADRGVAFGDQGAVGHAQRVSPVFGREVEVRLAEPTGGLTSYFPALVLGSAALEALDAAAGVDQLLLAGVERVALGAELDVQVVFRRPRVELVAARAMHVGERVLGVNSAFMLCILEQSGKRLSGWASAADTSQWKPQRPRPQASAGRAPASHRPLALCSSAAPLVVTLHRLARHRRIRPRLRRQRTSLRRGRPRRRPRLPDQSATSAGRERRLAGDRPPRCSAGRRRRSTGRFLGNDPSPPYPSPADIGYLAFYPLADVGV